MKCRGIEEKEMMMRGRGRKRENVNEGESQRKSGTIRVRRKMAIIRIRIRMHGSVTSAWNGLAVRTSASEALSNMSSRRSRTFAKLSLLI